MGGSKGVSSKPPGRDLADAGGWLAYGDGLCLGVDLGMDLGVE